MVAVHSKVSAYIELCNLPEFGLQIAQSPGTVKLGHEWHYPTSWKRRFKFNLDKLSDMLVFALPVSFFHVAQVQGTQTFRTSTPLIGLVPLNIKPSVIVKEENAVT